MILLKYVKKYSLVRSIAFIGAFNLSLFGYFYTSIVGYGIFLLCLARILNGPISGTKVEVVEIPYTGQDEELKKFLDLKNKGKKIMTENSIDMRALLKKYMQLIIQSEGFAYLHGVREDLRFTSEEIELLEKIESECEVYQ